MIYQIKKKELFFLLKYLLLFVAQILIIKTTLFSKSSFAQIPASKSCLEIDIKTKNGLETTLRVPGTNCYADCNAMPSGITANPGINGNCLYNCANLPIGTVNRPGDTCAFKYNNYMMPLCTLVPNISPGYTNTNHVISTGKAPLRRTNCVDLSDLPLCNQYSGGSNLGNCVNECSSNPNQIHNRDCVRFGNDPTSTATRKCHQVDDPQPDNNCELVKCNLLDPEELNEPKFNDSSKKFCSGDPLFKCQEFTSQQLNAVLAGSLVRGNNSLCKIHNCRVSDSCVANSTDDVSIIESRGNSYKDAYINKVIKPIDNSKGSLTDNNFCINLYCLGVIKKEYRCLPLTEAIATTKDANCTTDCTNSYCYKEIDCDNSANKSLPECTPLSVNPDLSFSDNSESYFYRPKPSPDSKTGTNFRTFDNKTNSNYNEFCYTKDQMKNYLGEGWGKDVLGGYWHDYLGYPSRSPGACNARKDGGRGVGISYLCGTAGITSRAPSDEVGYIKGEVSTNFTDEDASHSLSICLRYNNAMAPEVIGTNKGTCGARKCGITCYGFFGGCDSQVCGYDECRRVVVSDSASKNCIMNDDNFYNDNENKSCLALMGPRGSADGYIRVRAVKYEGKICAFLDFKGTLAWDKSYVDDQAKLKVPYCLSGTYDLNTQKCVDASGNALDSNNIMKICYSGFYNQKTDSCRASKNSNDNHDGATFWRTRRIIEYVQETYTTERGIRNYESECIRYDSVKAKPPKYFNLANNTNSNNLFSPSLYIKKVRRSGISSELSVIDSSYLPTESLAPTDFNKPSFDIAFGGTIREQDKLEIGVIQSSIISTSTASLSIYGSTLPRTYSAEVFFRKVFSDASEEPLFCLYRRYLGNDLQISCTRRLKPKINNFLEKAIGVDNGDFRKVVVGTSGSEYNNTKITYRFLSMSHPNYDTSGSIKNCSSAGATCSAETILTTSDPTQSLNESEACSTENEGYKVCAKREECSKLNVECVLNETARQSYLAQGNEEEARKLDTLSSYCSTTLLRLCNEKKGFTIALNPEKYTFDPNQFNQNNSSGNFYGWFNEICLIKGFDHDLKRVLAHIPSGQVSIAGQPPAIMGKCLIDSVKSLTPANCSNGGMAPYCVCTRYNESDPIPTGYYVRRETYREAGLCVDMPVPSYCSPIEISPLNPDFSDRYYVNHSLNKTSDLAYTNTNLSGVHISHYYRSQSSITVNSINYVNFGQATYPSALEGTTVRGSCNGYWNYQMGASSIRYPRATCTNNSGTRQFTNFVTPCIRYSCPAINSLGIQSDGSYSGSYGINDSILNKGVSEGYAYWNLFTKTNDFSELASANRCIVGFKKYNSSYIINSGLISNDSAKALFNSSSNNDLRKQIASIYQAITNPDDGGNLPTRYCNQIGVWQNVIYNQCQRIMCPALNFAEPASSSDNGAWAVWIRSKGSSQYPTTPASRTDIEANVPSESIASGVCNENIGFFQASGSSPPQRKCLSNGNWSEVINPCTSNCDAISQSISSSTPEDGEGYSINGYAIWNLKTGVSIGESSRVVAAGCVSGKFPYPYPPLYDEIGNKLEIRNDLAWWQYRGHDGNSRYIPRNIADDNRSANNLPVRNCRSISIPQSSSTASVWTASDSVCIDKCYGYTKDPRIGAGITSHTLSNGSVFELNWDDAAFDSWQIRTNCYSSTSNDFISNTRTNGCYAIARKCNSATHKWDDPIHLCASQGIINSTNHQINSNNGAFNSIIVGRSYIITGETSSTICYGTNYYPANGGTSPTPVYQCNNDEYPDKVYLSKISGDDCTQSCRSVNGQVFGNSYDHNSGTRYYNVGQTLNLTCNSGFASAISATLRTTGSNDSCGQLQYLGITDRSQNSPYVQCNSSGNWSSTFNDCTSCRSCNSSSRIYKYKIQLNDTQSESSLIWFPAPFNIWVPSTSSCTSARNCVSEEYKITLDSNGENGNNNMLYVNPNISHNSYSYRTDTNGRFHNPYCFPQGNTGVCGNAGLKCIDGSFYGAIRCKTDAGCAQPSWLLP
jgi:hypothetical protein